jgi:hypothetical protein
MVFAMNAVIAHRLFSIEFTSHMESTEGAFIAISRWATRHWGQLDWFPLWFTGMPFDQVYQPGYHLTVAAISTAFGITPQHAYHVVSAVVYSLGPVTLMLAVWYFARRLDIAVVTASLYSVISPSCLLIRDFRADTGGWLAYRRYLNVIKYADTPHLAVVMLVPIAVIAFDVAVVKRRWWAVPVATLLTSAIILTNWPGTVGFAMAMLAYLIAKHGEYDWRRVLLMFLAGYMIASPWVPPWTLMSVQQNAQESGWMSFGGSHVLYAAAVLGIAGALGFWIFPRFAASAWVRFTSLLLLFSGSAVMSRYWFHFQLLPQPHRWHVEMELAFVALAVSLAARIRPALIALALFSVTLTPGVIMYAASLTRSIDVRKTTEYRIAKWFDKHSTGRRVFAPGSVSMWMNNFTDVPQFAGCCDQGVPSFMHRVAVYTVYTGQNAGRDYVPISTIWLQAYGVHAIAVTGPDSGEMFHPYAYAAEFSRQLPELWRDGDDTIYEIPHLTASLAHVINTGDAVMRAPVHGLDVAPLRRYVAALLNTSYPEASFVWSGTARARIETILHRDQIVSVQVTYDRGWHALVDGVERPITRDALDQMLIHTGTEGRCNIDIVYRAPYSGALRMVAVAGCVLCAAVALTLRKRTALTV